MKKSPVVSLFLIAVAVLFVITLMTLSRLKDGTEMLTHNLVANSDVCPPFFLYDENGDMIDPVNGINANAPWSPRQTCGKCHDYDLITEGYHFQQGKGEIPDETYLERYQWVSHPGNYGGNWCSPAPLYRYLSPKENDNPRTMDLTSFSFITAGCGDCHPGGGSAEFDRNGNRYDHFMVEMGYEPGGRNDLDGDYYQARWSETGVLEADCMICHLPEYNNNERKSQLKSLNFRWAPSAGTGWAEVSGSVDKGTPVTVTYDLSKFDTDGRLSPNIVREPRTGACLFCHAQPGWKKRGANFSTRTDVHLNSGMKCVDCHAAGSKATDPRINQREAHQFAKGDDPGGRVRDDLDNTILSCDYCHTNGTLGAPVARHTWLPDLHLEKLACQTCHIPERLVKSAQFQAGDVYNPGTKIPSRGKHLWVFYGPDMKYYNHYGNMGMMGYDDKPTDPFRPLYAHYKDMIYPVNRIHSAWPGIEVEGKPGLMQPKMGDVVKMWEDHFADPSKYADLALITDDNGDGVIEVNRPEEIDALIASVTLMLSSINYPMEGKRVVWAMNERVYTSGTEFYTIEKELWEASPYANTHKYSHDIYPAKAALGAQSCVECHSLQSEMFYGLVAKYPFDEDGNTVWEPQYRLLGLNGFFTWISAVREQYLKSFQYPALLFLLLTILVSVMCGLIARHKSLVITRTHLVMIYLGLSLFFAFVWLKPDLNSYILPDRRWLDTNHFLITLIGFVTGIYVLLDLRKEGLNNTFLYKLTYNTIVVATISGLFMMLKTDAIMNLVRISYTLFEISIIGLTLICILYLIRKQLNIAVENNTAVVK
ncbi:MAG: cytochrome c3 family protein [Bacteroidales bacterium]